MKTLKFYKYQGTGNDFVLIDDRENAIDLSAEAIARVCHRRFGIGADGFILLRSAREYDFEMVYYNSDGWQSSMCGNGGRCIAQFAHDLGMDKNSYHFLAIDGPHKAEVHEHSVSLQMGDVDRVEARNADWFIDTGSPHHVKFCADPEKVKLPEEARAIRYAEPYHAEGVNVNFIALSAEGIQMRTYERGVEDETYSCGTGVTAAALVAHYSGKLEGHQAGVFTRGGNLKVKFSPAEPGVYKDIWLTGPATFVFEGKIEL